MQLRQWKCLARVLELSMTITYNSVRRNLLTVTTTIRDVRGDTDFWFQNTILKMKLWMNPATPIGLMMECAIPSPAKAVTKHI